MSTIKDEKKNMKEAIMLLWAEIKQLKRDMVKIRDYNGYDEESQIGNIEEQLAELLTNLITK
jgi:hypothetical protein